MRGIVMAAGAAWLAAGGVLAGEAGEPFPADGLMPKREIGVPRLLERHPAYDGRGVVVAIFDTGVDPGAPGLQTTSDGKPKIVDVVDASGSGDVDTSTVRELTDGRMRGLTGRWLVPGADWENPEGRYHVGLKAGYELFPTPLVERLKAKRREAWDARERDREAELRRGLAAWDAAHPKPDEAQRKERKDLELRIEQWRGMQQAYQDPGPIYDCVVFHDGRVWRAVVDTDEDGDLGEERVLTDYRLERGYATIGPEAQLNFAVNIYGEGRTLSIVVDSGTHGTHVAGIVAAHYPDQPELNGVAPGAQIVAVKIGDTRLDGMETATGFARGLTAVRKHRCDIINLSYGEPTAVPDRGRVIRLLSEVVNEDGVVFVSSAGNEGPALSTVGAPGGTSTALLGVGAYVSPEMMAAGYSLRERLPETQFTWSSRGPAADGDWGVDVSAPGAALAPVPTWTLQRGEHMNGTSMASPNAAGAVALLLSGLKAEGVTWSPASIRRALENTARRVPGVEPFAQGRGLVQVDAALEMCRLLAGQDLVEPRVEVALPQRAGARGVYLREPEESSRVLVTPVELRPRFPKAAEHAVRLAFERRYRLESTESWVTVPGHVFLVHDTRSFEVRVDPVGLAEGVHAAEVLGYEMGATNVGPAFRLPVTVIRPAHVDSGASDAWGETLRLGPAALQRRFFVVPTGATWAEVEVGAGLLDGPRRLVVHAVQLAPGQAFAASEFQHSETFRTSGRQRWRFPVTAGGTLEVCLGQSWSSLGEGDFDCALRFGGVLPLDSGVFLDTAARVARVQVVAPIRSSTLAPRGQLKSRQRTLTPSDTSLRPLDAARDRLPEERQVHELILSYSWKQDESRAVVPRFPALDGRLYEGEFESQLWMIFDGGKRLLAVDDGWKPGAVRVGKGEHVLRYHLRHDRTDWLERLKSLPLVLEEELGAPVVVEAFETPDQALTDGERFGERLLNPGDKAHIVFAVPALDAAAKGAQAGELMVGSVQYEAGAEARQYPIRVRVSAPASEAQGEVADDGTGDRTPEERLAESLRDFRVAQLESLRGKKDGERFEALAAELEAAYPEFLPLWVQRLHRLDDEKGRAQRLRSVVAAADAVIERIDRERLAGVLGVRGAEEDAARRRERRERERERDMLADALCRKARALAWMELADEKDEEDPLGADEAGASAPGQETEAPFEATEVEREFEETFAELRRWVDTTGSAYLKVHIRREWRQGRLGEVLKLLRQQVEEAPAERFWQKKRVRVLEDLGWSEWVAHERAWMLRRFPKDYPGF